LGQDRGVAVERKYELYGDDFRAATYETFARMRENDPVVRQPGIDGETPIWFVTRYEDAVAVLTDDDRFTRDAERGMAPAAFEAFDADTPDVVKYLDEHMLNKDGDDHRRLRRLVTKAFTPRMVEQLRPRIQEIADGLIDAVEARGEMNLVEDFAFPLPIIVIAELLGIPSEDRGRFRAWSNAMVTPAFTPEDRERFAREAAEFAGYLRSLFERRRSDPREDLVSALLQAEEDGDKLSESELFAMLALLITAGHETTVSLIGNATLALLLDPKRRAELAAEPSLIAAAVEELLRFDSPVERTLPRWATEDVELAGQAIKRGDTVIVILGSADRDPARFGDPDRIDFAREDNRHIAFGRGSHYCLGAPLARLEGEIALATLLRRLPGLRLAVPVEQLSWRPVPLFRSLVALPVAW
jgi:cytochrome P450